jgi:predicted transcriptional regulator
MVSVERFGKDHWSTFAYIAHCVQAKHGEPERSRMRTDEDRHPGLVGHSGFSFAELDGKTKKYPTRLAGGVELQYHDDWDCCDDLEAAGLLISEGTGIHPIYKLTDKGWEVLKQLTEHKNSGGSFGQFRMEATCSAGSSLWKNGLNGAPCC